METAKRILRTLERVLAGLQDAVLFIASILIVACIVFQIFLRAVLAHPLFGLEEIAVIAALWLYLIGAARCTRDQTHVSASIIHLVFKSRRSLETAKAIVSLVTLFLACMMTKWGYDYFLWGLTHKAVTPALRLNYIIPQSALFFGAILMCLYFLLELKAHIVNSFVAHRKLPEVEVS